MQRSSKRLVISSEKKNAHGFRVRTAGIDMTDFAANPLLLWMHKRPTGHSKDEILPLGYWDDVQVEGEKITGVPCFDPDDAFAMTIYSKVEKGIIKMASAGLAPKNQDWQLIGDDLWLNSSVLKEASLVDIASNTDAIEVALYDEHDALIALSADFIQSITHMEIIKLSGPDIAAKLQLAPQGLTAELVMQKIGELVTLADSQKATIESLNQEREQAIQKRQEAEQKHADLVKLQHEQKVIALVDAAISERRITADQKEHFVKLASLDYDTTEATLKSLPASIGLKDALQQSAGKHNPLITLSYQELDKQGKLAKLKSENPELFKQKYKEHFGKDYKEA